MPDDVYEGVRTHLSEKELSDLTFLVMAINAWNRVNIGFQVGTWHVRQGIGPGQIRSVLIKHRHDRVRVRRRAELTHDHGSLRPSNEEETVTIFRTLAVLLLLAAGTAGAQEAPTSARVTPLMTKTLADYPGKETLMLTVDYPPGAVDPVHRHHAHSFIYVLEGSIVMSVQVESRDTDGRPDFLRRPERCAHHRAQRQPHRAGQVSGLPVEEQRRACLYASALMPTASDDLASRKPEVVNSDQGSQFTRIRLCRPSGKRSASSAWTGVAPGGNNVSVECLKSVKYEQMQLHALTLSLKLEHQSSNTWMGTTDLGPHSGSGRETPDETYAVMLPTVELAA